MRKIVFIVGVLCLLYVSLGLVAGLLPIDFWSYILDFFIERNTYTYYKIVPTEGTNYQVAFVTLLGVVLIILSKIKFKSTDDGQT
jgi:hypothetical protein